MQFNKGAKLVTQDGQQAGVVDRVVIDPKSKLVSDLVTRQGWLFHEDKVIPIDQVASTTEDEVVLKNGIDLDHLQTYEELHYVAVDEEELGKMDYTPTYAPPLYFYPPFGPGYIATPRPPSGSPAYRVEAEHNLPEDTVALRPGAKVLSNDDIEVGKITEVFTESTTQEATHFVVSKGLLAPERKLVPLAWVEEICEDEVHLTVSARQLERLPDYTGSQS